MIREQRNVTDMVCHAVVMLSSWRCAIPNRECSRIIDPGSPRVVYDRFSSEICGTIIVQCIPILRPFLKEVTTTFQSSSKRSRQSSIPKSTKERASFGSSIPLKNATESRHLPNEEAATETDSDSFIFGGVVSPKAAHSQRTSGKVEDIPRSPFSPQPSPQHEPSHEQAARPWSSGR